MNRRNFLFSSAALVAAGLARAAERTAHNRADYEPETFANKKDMLKRTFENGSRFADKIRSGKTALGAVVALEDPVVSEMVAAAGLDFAWIDVEHAPLAPAAVQRHLLTLHGTGVAGIVRVHSADPRDIRPFLDIAPDGILAPMVSTYDQARAVVDACRYPQAGGKRGMCVRRANRWGAQANADYLRRSAVWPLVICEIEHIDALKELDRILAIPEVDSICIGPCDLSCSMGGMATKDTEEVQKVVDEIAAKAHKAGKLVGSVGTPDGWKKRGRPLDWTAVDSDTDILARTLRSYAG